MPRLLILSLIVTSAMAFGSQDTVDAGIVLIDSGLCRASIVLPASSIFLERKAACEIQHYLSEISGASVPIFAENTESPGPRILVGRTVRGRTIVGESSLNELSPESFVIKTKDTDVAIVGGGGYGTLYGAYEVIERYFGVLWYLPDPLGEIIPERETITLPEIDISQSPAFEMRWVGKDTTWNLRNKMNRVLDPAYPPAFEVEPGIYHTQQNLLPTREYFPTHPEYFALIDGERSDDPDAKLCYSNPELPAVIARSMSDLLRQNTEIDLISFSPTDGQFWCECEGCLALDETDVEPDRRYSRRSLVFYNRIAEALEPEFPDVRILVGAYNVYNQTPKDKSLKAHPNLCTIVTHYEDYCKAHSITSPSCPRNANYRRLVQDWQDLVGDVFFYEYYYKVNWSSLPWPIVHCISREIPYFRDIGVKGLYTQYTQESMWTNLLPHYVAAKLLWNPDLDVGAMLAEFYDLFYGEAAEPMRRYYETMEESMQRCQRHFPGGAFGNGQRVFTREVVDKLERHLAEAEKRGAEEKVKRRLAKVRVSLDYTRLFAECLRAREGLKEQRHYSAFQNTRARFEAGLEALAEFSKRSDEAASGVIAGGALRRRIGIEKQKLERREAPERVDAERHGLVTDWIVIGPFDNENWAGFELEYGPERKLDLAATCDGKDGPVGWKPLDGETSDGYVDLANAFDNETWAIAYALRYVESPGPMTAQMRLGSNDSASVWVGGKRVHGNRVERAARLDEDIIPVQIPAGRTPILLKIGQAGGSWGFFFRITDPEGNPLPNLLEPLESSLSGSDQ